MAKVAENKMLFRILWGLVVASMISVIAFFLILSQQNLPTFEDLENPKYELASVVYFNNKEEIGRYFTQNRVPVRFNELNPLLINALISTEDERYYKHAGIDMQALGRVLVKSIVMGQESSGGGSTITQQLAKLLYPRNNYSGLGRLQRATRLAISKFKEWITAVKLERAYTKEEIISMYLNKFEFIYDSYGIRAASETYFGKKQEELKVEEAAVLIGMLKNPTLFNPKKFPENSVNRRNVVMYQMYRHDLLTKAQYDSLKQTPLDISNFKRKSQSDGMAPYLLVEISKRIKNILNQPQYLKADGTAYDIYKDGLNIHTTIDPEIQAMALEAVREHMPDLQKKYYNHWRGMNPFTYSSEQRPIIRSVLNRLMKETDRYISRRYSYLGKDIEKINEEIGNIIMTDTEIEWIIAESKRPGKIAGLLAKGTIRRDKANKMKEILKSDLWPPFREKYEEFSQAIKKEFDQKTSCRVFDYHAPNFEKDTLMSPLDSIKFHMKFLQTGVMAMEPKSGSVKAWVGGINHQYFKFDHVTSNRQVGSTFKPFVYTTAVLNGISPCREVVDQPYTISPGENNFYLTEPWTPTNSKTFSGEKMTLYRGLKNSVNSISVFLMKSFGSAEPVRETAVNMGLDPEKVPPYPSIALGTPELTVEELTAAYNVFANDGIYTKPMIITSIKDKNGKVIYSTIPFQQRALPAKSNYVMIDMLRQSIGGGRAGLQSVDLGGKTGTTNDHVDGWFMGISPNLVIGSWVGGDYPWIRFRDLATGQGGVMARPMFTKLMKKLETLPKEKFDPELSFRRPLGNLGITIDCDEFNKENPGNLQDEFDSNQGLEDEFDIGTNPRQ